MFHVLGLIFIQNVPQSISGGSVFSTSECSRVYGTHLSCCCLSSAYCLHTASFTIIDLTRSRINSQANIKSYNGVNCL